jgi:hypothetical protein
MQDRWGVLIGFGIKGQRRTSSREVNIFRLHPQSTVTIISGIMEIGTVRGVARKSKLCA